MFILQINIILFLAIFIDILIGEYRPGNIHPTWYLGQGNKKTERKFIAANRTKFTTCVGHE